MSVIILSPITHGHHGQTSVSEQSSDSFSYYIYEILGGPLILGRDIPYWTPYNTILNMIIWHLQYLDTMNVPHATVIIHDDVLNYQYQLVGHNGITPQCQVSNCLLGNGCINITQDENQGTKIACHLYYSVDYKVRYIFTKFIWILTISS